MHKGDKYWVQNVPLWSTKKNENGNKRGNWSLICSYLHIHRHFYWINDSKYCLLSHPQNLFSYWIVSKALKQSIRIHAAASFLFKAFQKQPCGAIHKNIFACLFSVHNTISLSRRCSVRKAFLNVRAIFKNICNPQDLQNY